MSKYSLKSIFLTFPVRSCCFFFFFFVSCFTLLLVPPPTIYTMTHPIIIIFSKQGALSAPQQLVETVIPHSLSALSPNSGLTSKPTMIGFLAQTFTEGLHRLMEQARLEGNSKDHLAQSFMWNRATMKSFSILFKTSNNGDSTRSVGRLFSEWWFSM